MTDPTTLTTESDPDYNRIKTRQRREARADQIFEVTIGERTEIHCDECDESDELLVAAASDDVSYGPCSTWDCDSFHKYELEEPVTEPEPEDRTQLDLATFDGGTSA